MLSRCNPPFDFEDVLPFIQFFYDLGNTLLIYDTDSKNAKNVVISIIGTQNEFW